MKQGTNFKLPVTFEFDDGTTKNDIKEIQFIFKQSRDKNSRTLKTSVYNFIGTGDASMDSGDEIIVYVPWSKEDTYKFKPDKPFYMDTLVFIKNSFDNPPTPIVELVMDETLF